MRGQIRRCYRIGFVVCCAISVLWIHPMTKRIRTEYQDWDEGIRKNIYCLFACVRTSWNQPKFQKATGLMQSNNPYDKFFLQGFGLTCFFPRFVSTVLTIYRETYKASHFLRELLYKSHDACRRPSSPLAFKTEQHTLCFFCISYSCWLPIFRIIPCRRL